MTPRPGIVAETSNLGDSGPVAPAKRHDASRPERDGQGEVDGPVPGPVVGDRHRRRANGGGKGAEVAVSPSGAADSAELAGGQLARAGIHRGGARSLLPDTWFEEGHLGRNFARSPAETLAEEGFQRPRRLRKRPWSRRRERPVRHLRRGMGHLWWCRHTQAEGELRRQWAVRRRSAWTSALERHQSKRGAVDCWRGSRPEKPRGTASVSPRVDGRPGSAGRRTRHPRRAHVPLAHHAGVGDAWRRRRHDLQQLPGRQVEGRSSLPRESRGRERRRSPRQSGIRAPRGPAAGSAVCTLLRIGAGMGVPTRTHGGHGPGLQHAVAHARQGPHPASYVKYGWYWRSSTTAVRAAARKTARSPVSSDSGFAHTAAGSTP